MDRNREARRAATNMAAPPNGLRRRHRSSSSLRDSPDEDGGGGGVEVQEAAAAAGRLRDRGLVKKDRGDRDRDRSSRSKRRRESRMMAHHHHVNTGSNRDDNTSDEEEEEEEVSVNDDDEEEEDDNDAGNGGGLRMLPPPPANPYSSQQIHHRKSFPSSTTNNNNKVFRASTGAPPPPAWKAAEEMIGVPVPRKARSASTKRSHEWISGVVADRQSSASPVRLASSTASPSPVAPPSPSSSSVSVRKKMKSNGGGSKPRPPKSSSKSSSSNPEELEIEIAEVLYGLMTQSQAPSKKETPPSNDSTTKFDSNKSLSAVAPKRKRPRQVSENPVSSSIIKTEIDHHQSPKTDISSPYLEHASPAAAAAAENGVSSFSLATAPSSEPQSSAQEEGKSDLVLTKEEVEKDSAEVGLNDGNSNTEGVMTTATTTTTDLKPESESHKEGKFEIDLMASPPQHRTSLENEFSDHKQQMVTQEMSKTKEDHKLEETAEEQKETGESSKQANNVERNIDLHIDFEKPNKSLHQALKHQQLSTKSETHTEKTITAQPSSLPIPLSVPNWPPMGYVAPLQGVISMDGNAMSSAPIQPLFTHPRPKRCATHCYIARNIHYLQQFMKINPFWPAASAPAAPMFSVKHGIPSTELHANVPQSMQDKGHPVGIFPGHTPGKDTKSSQTAASSDPAHRKQQVLLQQAMPSVTPNNILHGPAFIFPFNQQQAVAASASVRSGSSKVGSSTGTGGLGATVSGAANSATVSSSATAAAAPSLSFSYPNMSASETQYLAIVQNHPYAFPIPAVGAPPNYRGNHPHPQAMPLFNGSFYSSQMIHPSQIPQPPQQAPLPTQSQQTHQNSSGSTSSSQKHLQAQQRQHGSGAAANGGGSGNAGGLHNSYPAVHKSRSQQPSHQMNPPAQARHLENEAAGGEDSPSTADSRVSRAATNITNVYGHNFAMPVHSQNFALMNPQQAVGANSNEKKHQSQQQVLKRVGVESSSLPPQTFAMSFAPMNGTISSMAQNHAIFQSLPESSRQGYQHMMTSSSAAAASAHHSEQKKDFRTSEEATKTTGHDSSNINEDRKGGSGLIAKSGQSIAFSRPDLATDASTSSAAAVSGTSVIDSSSSRNINLGSNNRATRSPISTSAAAAAQSSHHLHAQFQQQQQQQQQQILQLQKQQQQHANARSKNPPLSSNGSGYPEHLITSSSAMTAMFPNSLSSFPLQTSNINSSPVQSPQWRNSVRGSTASQVSSSLTSTTSSSLKNVHQTHQSQQQQSSRSHTQSHTQISFGAAAVASQKLQLAQMQLPLLQQQQQQNQNPSSNNQSPSPPMLVGSPTTSLSSSQQPKNTVVGTQRSSSSMLGNPTNSTSTKSQQQQQQQQQQQPPQQPHKQTLQQQHAYAQMMYSHPYMVQQPQAQQHSVGSTAGSGYYLPRKQQQQQQSTSSTAMLSLCPPVTLASTTTSDPAKAIAAATSNLKGGVRLAPQQGALHAAPYGGNVAPAHSSISASFPQYVHNAPSATAAAAAVQAKSTEQKQPAGE